LSWRGPSESGAAPPIPISALLELVVEDEATGSWGQRNGSYGPATKNPPKASQNIFSIFKIGKGFVPHSVADLKQEPTVLNTGPTELELPAIVILI